MPEETTLYKKIDPAFFTFAAEHSPHPMVFMRDAETPLYVNPGFTKTFGYQLKDITPIKNWFKRAYPDPDYRKMVEDEWYKTYNQSSDGFPVIREFRVSAKDGSIRDIIFKVHKKNEYCVIFFEEVTAQRCAEMELRKSEKHYRTIFNNINDGFIISDLQGNILDLNGNSEDMSGYTREELTGSNISMIAPPERIRELVNYLAGNNSIQFEGMLRKKSGERIPVNVSSSVVSREGDGIIQSFIRDISPIKRVEEALRASEEKYRNLVNNANDAIFVADAETGIILDVNRQGEILVGRSRYEIIGMHQAQLHPESESDRYRDIFSEHGRRINRITDGLVVQHSNGYVIPVEISASVTQLQGRRIIQGIFRDITERKKREEEHLKTMKLESIEMLAGGIAHDLNNILTAIMGNLTLARMHVDRESQAWPMLSDAEQASIRANDLTRQLLTFSHEGVLSTQPSSLEELVRDSTIFVLRGSSISCTFDFQDGLWSIEVDRVQFSQVVQNLVINAKQSMPGGGIIEIHACNHDILDIDIDVLKPGKYVLLSISDQGCGISEENLLRIFDPYYTTRESGTGLGLSISYSIIQRHGGTIHVSSVEGEGTTFQLYIPASITGAKNHEKDEFPVSSGSGRILVMDDEQMVRQIVGDMLEHLGYEVCMASDGKEAVEIYRELHEEGECYDAVLMDLTVQGGMGGLEALRKIRQIDENARVIVASGYSNDNVMVKFSDYGFVGKIEKPFNIERLCSVLKDVIDN